MCGDEQSEHVMENVKRTSSLFVTAVLVCSVFTVPQPATAAQDKYPGDCQEADFQEPGVFQGRIDVKSDIDVLKFDVERGDTIPVRFNTEERLRVDVFLDGGYNGVSVVNMSGPMEKQGGYSVFFPSGGPESSLLLRAQSSGTLCMEMSVHYGGGESLDSSQIPFHWRAAVDLNTAEAPDYVPASETLQERTAELESRVSELQQQLQTKDDRISELRAQVEQRNRTISQLSALLEQKNQSINELESHSSDGSDEEVTIDVNITPANGQQNFIEGGEALVQAESENADVGELSVEYGSGTYQLDPTGTVAIPLAESGTRTLTLLHSDIMKQVSIEVQAENGQNQQQDTPDESGPGFGILTAFIAVLGSAFLLYQE